VFNAFFCNLFIGEKTYEHILSISIASTVLIFLDYQSLNIRVFYHNVLSYHQ